MSELQTEKLDFRGGIQLPVHKEESGADDLAVAAIPDRLVVPLLQHLGHACEPRVEVGTHVDRNQVLAASDALISAPVHAPTSGTVLAIEDRPVPHPGNLSSQCVVLESDGKDTALDTGPGVDDVADLEPAEVRNRIRNAGITGLGGAVFPTAVKLTVRPDQPLRALILNAAECDPYISCDNMLIKTRPADIVTGAQIMMYALQVNACIIAIKDHRPEAEQIMRDAIAQAADDRLEVRTVTDKYPAGGERQLIEALTGNEVPYLGLPMDIGYVVQNVGTAAAVKHAIVDAQPLISRIVTVTGPGVARPCNLEVRFGTLIADIVAQCGGYTERAERLIIGGPMMGFALQTDQVPVVKGCNCILVAGREDVRTDDIVMPCIRCGDCASVCPARLLPQQLYWHIRAGNFSDANDYNLLDCIECGACDYVCPSHIPLAQYFRYGKSEVWHEQEERRRADSARQRFEFREQRLARDQQEKQARLEAKKRSLSGADENKTPTDSKKTVGKEQIDEIMERVRHKEQAMRDQTDESDDKSGDDGS